MSTGWRSDSYTDRKTSDTLETVTIARDTGEHSGFDAGQVIEDLASNWDMDIKSVKATGNSESYKYVDFYVLRVNLNGRSQESIDEIIHDIRTAPTGCGLGGQSTQDGKRIREELVAAVKHRSHHSRSEAERFVNVASGTYAEVRGIRHWWRQHGVSDDFSDQLPGPMLLTTVRGSRGTVPVPMAVTTGTLSSELKAHFEMAYDAVDFEADTDLANQLSALPSGLSGRPKWNTHSLRRGGAKLAREILLASGSTRSPTEEDINFHFGWFEEAMRGGKKRQTAYASTVPAQRRMSVTKKF